MELSRFFIVLTIVLMFSISCLTFNRFKSFSALSEPHPNIQDLSSSEVRFYLMHHSSEKEDDVKMVETIFRQRKNNLRKEDRNVTKTKITNTGPISSVDTKPSFEPLAVNPVVHFFASGYHSMKYFVLSFYFPKCPNLTDDPVTIGDPDSYDAMTKWNNMNCI
jgi:hypothetical protein